MSRKKQTRRSISIKGKTYERLRSFCQDHGLSMSGVVEALVLAKLDSAEHFPSATEIAKTAQPFRAVNTRPKKPEPSKEEIETFFPGGVHNF